MGKQWKQCQSLFWGAPKSLRMVTAAMKLKDAYSLEEKLWPTWIACWKAGTLLCQQRSVQSSLWFFQCSCTGVRVGLWRKLSAEELMLLNCGVGEDSWEFLGLQGHSQAHSEGDQPWDFFGRNDPKAETPVLSPPHAELTHWKRLLCWEGLGAGGEGDEKGWDGWMASLTQWTWVWVNSRSWWWTGRLGVLRFIGSQRVRHDWATDLNQTELEKK